jgi:hypothetical protein
MSRKNNRKLNLTSKYKAELEAQLSERNKKAKFEFEYDHNPNDQKVSSDDYVRFKQKEFERIRDERERTKQVMMDNQFSLSYKANEQTSLAQQDKDVFNRQALEDKLHAERVEEEKRRLKEWQKESLKNDYEEQIRRREHVKQLERQKDRAYATEFKHTVEKYEHDHNKALEDRRQKNAKVLDEQQRTVIPDMNARRKDDAIQNMHRQFENTERETLKTELDRLNKRFSAAKETDDVLKMQMDIRKRKQRHTQMDDQSDKQYVDSTVSLLGERDRKVAEEK